MKTLTEFPSMTLKNAAKTRQDLIAGGKPAEELPTAMGEALKLEGDKLNFLMNALELVGTQLNDLKRTVVYALHEGEKAPHGVIQKGDHYYLVEHYVSHQKHSSQDEFGEKREGRGKGRGDKKHGRRPEGRSGERPGNRPAGDRPERQPRVAAPRGPQIDPTSSTPPAEGGERAPRPPRRPKFERKPVDKNNPGEIPASLRLAPLAKSEDPKPEN